MAAEMAVSAEAGHTGSNDCDGCGGSDHKADAGMCLSVCGSAAHGMVPGEPAAAVANFKRKLSGRPPAYGRALSQPRSRSSQDPHPWLTPDRLRLRAAWRPRVRFWREFARLRRCWQDPSPSEGECSKVQTLAKSFRVSRRSFLAGERWCCRRSPVPGLAGSHGGRLHQLPHRCRSRANAPRRRPLPRDLRLVLQRHGSWPGDPGPSGRASSRSPSRTGSASETTVHWHGLRVPNAMDGVPHLTQRPIAPRRDLRLRVRGARCRHLLVPPAPAQLRAGRARPLRAR